MMLLVFYVAVVILNLAMTEFATVERYDGKHNQPGFYHADGQTSLQAAHSTRRNTQFSATRCLLEQHLHYKHCVAS
jgi:hypothetical protein